jgi:uncharacterized protein
MPDDMIRADSQSPATGTSASPSQEKHSGIATIFLGPNGIRAGWRILLFICFFQSISYAMGKILSHIPYVVSHFPPIKAGVPAVLTAGLMIYYESRFAFCLLAAVLLMKLIERRSFADYGLPLDQFLGKRFWIGVPFGFALLSLLLGTIAALHGFSLGPVELTSAAALKYAFLYGIVFIIGAFCEEFAFRGYLQATLGSGIGFWGAAILLSILFGALHLSNWGEAIVGAASAGAFGLVAAFSLARTGSIWFAIGLHAAWDWAETYFYGVPDSGMMAKGHLFTGTVHGPNWLTGGTVGPEGSYFVLGVLAVSAIGIHFLFPARRNT